MTAASLLWEFDKKMVTPAVRQMLTYAEIKRHREESRKHLLLKGNSRRAGAPV